MRPHGLQHTRLLCPSHSPGVCSSPLSRWCCLSISSSADPLLLLPSIFPSISLFQWVNSLHQVVKVLDLQLQHQSFQVDRGRSHESYWLTLDSSTPNFKGHGPQITAQCQPLQPDLTPQNAYISNIEPSTVCIIFVISILFPVDSQHRNKKLLHDCQLCFNQTLPSSPFWIL